MDFPVCPSCGQSVIDDDAEDCPFCGSSMKAKPGSKPAAKPAAKAAATSKSDPSKASAGAKSAPAGKATASKASAADDFPFEAEVPGAKSAVQAMPNPSKGRSHQVTCPMCETTGYVPPSAVGKDVKCANAKCMVPIFKAPAAAAEAPPPPPPKKSNLVLVGGVTVAIMAIGGVAAVFLPGMLASGTKPVKPMSDEDRKLIIEMAGGNKPIPTTPVGDNDIKPLPDKPDEKKPTDTAPKSPDEFIAAAIKQLNDSSLVGDRRQRSKAYCRQLAADACVLSGDNRAANEHLAQLVVVGKTVPYYRIEPNLEMFWHAWAAGDKAGANKALEAALADAPKLPSLGRNQLEVGSRLAAALVVAGRVPDAVTMVKEHQSADLEGQLSARVLMSSAGRISAIHRYRAVLPWTKPQAASTTASLVARGYLKEGRTWAEAQTDEESRVECLAIWAETVASKQPAKGAADTNADIVEAVKPLSPGQAARVWARAACGRFAAGDSEGAEATLKVAEGLVAGIALPAEPEFPAIKAATTYKLPTAAPLVQAATAAAEIAYVHSLWPTHRQQAEESLERALTFARGLAPAWAAVSAKKAQADQLGAGGLRDMIKKELALKSDDLAEQNASKYRKTLADLTAGSTRRTTLQESILSRLSEAGMKDKVWSVVSNRSAESNANKRDDFLNSRLAGELLEAFQGTETEKIIQGALGENSAHWSDQGTVRHYVRQQNLAEAAQFVSKLNSDSGQRDDVALTFATYLAATDKVDAALGFISKLEDIVLREEAYMLSAALLAQRGHADAVWKQVLAVPQATEKASLCRGLVVGLKAGAPQKELPEPALIP